MVTWLEWEEHFQYLSALNLSNVLYHHQTGQLTQIGIHVIIT